MNDRIRELFHRAYGYPIDIVGEQAEKFAELVLASLAEELLDVAERSKKVNPEWANGVDHAAMLAQRMLMDLPQWPEAE